MVTKKGSRQLTIIIGHRSTADLYANEVWSEVLYGAVYCQCLFFVRSIGVVIRTEGSESIFKRTAWQVFTLRVIQWAEVNSLSFEPHQFG